MRAHFELNEKYNDTIYNYRFKYADQTHTTQLHAHALLQNCVPVKCFLQGFFNPDCRPMV
jgi:hypothetical protein